LIQAVKQKIKNHPAMIDMGIKLFASDLLCVLLID